MKVDVGGTRTTPHLSPPSPTTNEEPSKALKV